MSTTTNRKTAPRDGDSVDHRLARLLDTPLLARIVPHLPPETLHALIRHRGLDACVELVTSATPSQLTSLLDLDLWRPAQPGRDDQFDVDRFGEWIEVLVDAGESAAARTVAALDRHTVIVGLSRYLRVFDPGIFEPTEATDNEPMDRNEMMNSEVSGDLPECEVGGYLVRARRTDGWDAIVTLLVTLETEHDRAFHALMQGCRRLSNSTAEVDGLDELLKAPEQQLHDVVVERERRRSRQGYATPADARAFLQMARRPRSTSAAPATPAAASAPAPAAVPPAAGRINPIVTAYFRAVDEDADDAPAVLSAEAPEHVGRAAGPKPASAPADQDVSTPIDAVIALLAEAGVMTERPRALLQAADEDPRAASLPHLQRSMAALLPDDESAYLTRTRELAFLANTLLAGSSVQGRPFAPQEASEAAACVCNLGLERMPPDASLADHDLVTAFEVGWSVLYEEVSLLAADQLIAILGDIGHADADTRHELGALRRTLVKHREAGTPWLARDAADVLARLDVTAWISVAALLDECPSLPAALTAVLERRTSPISPTAFEFISTTAQLGDIRLFMKALPGVLSG
jgi:hypothetical protein